MDTNMTLQSVPKARPDVIVSVPHSGTHFLKHHFGCESIHANVPWHSIMRRLPANARILVPLRKPEDVWASWGKRYEHPDLAHFLSGWYIIHALSLVCDIDFININAQVDKRISEWTPRGILEEYPYTPKPLPKNFRNGLYLLPYVNQHFGLPAEPDELGNSE